MTAVVGKRLRRGGLHAQAALKERFCKFQVFSVKTPRCCKVLASATDLANAFATTFATATSASTTGTGGSGTGGTGTTEEIENGNGRRQLS